jgi:hypothetical protein
MNDEHHDTDEEEDPRDLRGHLGYPKSPRTPAMSPTTRKMSA